MVAVDETAETLEIAVERRPRRKRRLSSRLAGLAVILLALWSGYWLVAYGLANAVVRNAEAAEAPLLACAERAFGGFPLTLTFNCSGASAATNDGGVRASLIGVAAAAPLYTPGRVVADVVGPFRLEAPGFVVDAAWNKGDATVDAGLVGTVGAAATFDRFRLNVAETAGAPMFAAEAATWRTEIRPAAEPDAIQLALAAEDLVFTIDQTTLPRLTATATLTLLDSGGRLDRAPMAVLRTWLANGGAFRIDEMTLASGQVRAEVTGALALGLDGALSGDLTLRYTGQEDLPLLVAAVFPFLADDAEAIAAALMALSRPIQMAGEPAFETRLHVLHGALKYGLIPIPGLAIPSLGPLHHLL